MKYNMSDLLPHRAPAILIDDVVDWNEISASVNVLIRQGIPFFNEENGVPAHVGLEYMAQCCGAYAGLQGLAQNIQPRLGFLLGTRDYKCIQPWFLHGTTLIVSAREIFRHENMGSFACTITCDGIELASAQLNVFQPDNPAEFLITETNK